MEERGGWGVRAEGSWVSVSLLKHEQAELRFVYSSWYRKLDKYHFCMGT